MLPQPNGEFLASETVRNSLDQQQLCVNMYCNDKKKLHPMKTFLKNRKDFEKESKIDFCDPLKSLHFHCIGF